MKLYSIMIASLLLTSCTGKVDVKETSLQDFENDLTGLKEYFHIPGLSVLVKKKGNTIYENYFGYADIDNQQALDSASMFPIASVTKTFASVLLLQLVEQGKVGLDEPINLYLEKSTLSDSIKINHVLSHSSEGTPGVFFNYSYRFSLLTQVIEQVSTKEIDELVKAQIIHPLGLRHTLPLTSQETLDSLENRLAKPYYFQRDIEAGHYDYGFSSSSGLASTVRDLAKFDNALASDQLISEESKKNMFTPFGGGGNSGYPYGYGIFTQRFLGKEIKWGFGQEDCFSSLLLKVPEDGLTLILLANNNLMSDPARLINGDITYSLFAMSFLKHFVFDLPREYLSMDFSEPESLQFDFVGDKSRFKPFYRQELFANALAASFMGARDSLEMERCERLTQVGLSQFPNYEEYGNQTLIRLLMVLSTYQNHSEFDKPLMDLGTALLSTNKYDPYTNVYLGYHYRNLNKLEKASEYFTHIAEAPNLQPFWYTIEACDYLGDYYKENDPDLAKKYFQNIVDIGWNMGGKLDKAKEELTQL